MFKRLIPIVLIGALGLAFAAPQIVTIEGTALKPVTAAQASELRGQFQMSNGKLLSLMTKGRKLIAEMDGMPTSELKSTGDQRLVSADGKVDLSYKAMPNGIVTSVTLKYVAAK
jgi:hypothetical protein